jgi:hypothetical protein
VTIKVGGIFYLPLIIDNPLETPIDVDLSVQAPEGWHVVPTGIATVGPHTRYFLRVQAQAPPAKLVGWQNFVVAAESNHKSIGEVSVRVELSTGWVASQ